MNGLRHHVQAALENDPAATGWLEVLLLYPGVHALLAHRIAHALYKRGLRLPARAVAQFARRITGVEIHPAAKIGCSVFIDHGMGVVIGETAEVGDGVVIYHGVTLGGTGLSRGKRHPTVEDGVRIGAGAAILGPVTIGENATIGAGSVVTSAVEPEATVVGVPAEPISDKKPTVTGNSCIYRFSK